MIALIVYIALIGLVVYAVTTFLPMPEQFKKLIYILGGILCLFILLRVFSGVLPSLNAPRL
jgi:hypothetical protein